MIKFSFTGHKIPSFLLMRSVGQSCLCHWGWCLTSHQPKQNALGRQSSSRSSPNQSIACGWELLETWLYFPSTLSDIFLHCFFFHIFSSQSWRFSLEALKCLCSSISHSPMTLFPYLLPFPSTAFMNSAATFSFTVYISVYISGNKSDLSPQLKFNQL